MHTSGSYIWLLCQPGWLIFFIAHYGMRVVDRRSEKLAVRFLLEFPDHPFRQERKSGIKVMKDAFAFVSQRAPT